MMPSSALQEYRETVDFFRTAYFDRVSGVEETTVEYAQSLNVTELHLIVSELQELIRRAPELWDEITMAANIGRETLPDAEATRNWLERVRAMFEDELQRKESKATTWSDPRHHD